MRELQRSDCVIAVLDGYPSVRQGLERLIRSAGWTIETCGLIVFALALLGDLRAQGTSARITGTIRDTSGGVIASCEVKAVSVETAHDWSTRSNEAGIYSVLALPPGDYTVSVEARGFKRVVTNTITLEVNQIAGVDLVLEVGAVTETLIVTGVDPLLQNETTQLGSTITGSTTVNLPLNGRNFSQLTLLAPGVVTFDTATYTDGSRIAGGNIAGGRPLVNGNRAQANNFRLDGFDSNEEQDNLIAYYPS